MGLPALKYRAPLWKRFYDGDTGQGARRPPRSCPSRRACGHLTTNENPCAAPPPCAAPGPRHPRATSTVVLLKKCQGTCAWSDVAGGPTSSWEEVPHRGRVPHKEVPYMAVHRPAPHRSGAGHGTRGQGTYWQTCMTQHVAVLVAPARKRIQRSVSRVQNPVQAWQPRAREHALQPAEVRTRTRAVAVTPHTLLGDGKPASTATTPTLPAAVVAHVVAIRGGTCGGTCKRCRASTS